MKKVQLVFDCYEGEEIDAIQENAMDDFEANIQSYTQSGLGALEGYILKNYSDQIEGKTISNIFKYVVPRTIYVSKDPSKKKAVGLICRFKFDDENGVAIKYVDGVVTEIGGEQVVL